MIQLWRCAQFALPLFLFFGCGDSGGDGPADATPDTGMDAPAGDVSVPDASPPDASLPQDICDRLGLPRAEFQADMTGNSFGDLAGDFTVDEVGGGQWSLAEEWTGCESYVFLTYFAGGRGDELFRTLPDDFFREGPENVHYFFTSYENDAAARTTRMERLQSDVEEGLMLHFGDDADARESWMQRMHFVTNKVEAIPGSIGRFMNTYIAYIQTEESIVDLGMRGQARAPAPYVLGIARDQTFDAGGTLSPSVGMPYHFKMARFLPDFYNHRAALRTRLAAEEGVTEIELMDEDVTDRIFVRTVMLPDATAMSAVDTLEFDIAITCSEGNPLACSEWDRIARIEWCADAECSSRQEVVRWITPYWRRGRRRWAVDASPFLALMRAGGEQTFRIEMGPGWERATQRRSDMSLRLSTRGGDHNSYGVQYAFGGGSFGAEYNTREPVAFTPPADATRVEVVYILSGHGQNGGNNCAEWCDHRHQFTVNGTDLPRIQHEPFGSGIGSVDGCGEMASQGNIPGQWGNWAPERAYWCPSLPLDAKRMDITSLVRLGEANELTYQAFYRSGAPQGGSIALSSYVIWYN